MKVRSLLANCTGHNITEDTTAFRRFSSLFFLESLIRLKFTACCSILGSVRKKEFCIMTEIIPELENSREFRYF